MQTCDVGDLNTKITNYFQRFFKDHKVNPNTRLIDLGFESIDHIELTMFLFKTTAAALDIAKVNQHTRIADIPSLVVKLEQEKSNHKKMVALDSYHRYVYSAQLKDDNCPYVTYLIHHLCLKESIDIDKLRQAIANTLSNHFILNSKLIRMIDDYFFESTASQSDFSFKGSFLFPKTDLGKLIISVRSDRLVNIYLQKKGKQNYLIIAFHHIALDGWSHKIIQEEIFRRYAGLYANTKKNVLEEISALNSIYSSSLNQESDTAELAALLKPIDPYQYNHLNHIFYGDLQVNYTGFVISKEELDHYAQRNYLNDFPYSVIFSFMLHQMIHQASGVDKLMVYTSLSNRNLPVSRISELVGNFVTGLPLFLNSENLESRQFAAKINESLNVYFKNMSYGATTRILLENNTLLNEFLSSFHQPYWLMLTYINNISKMIYGNDSITSEYIDWDKSKTNLCIQYSRGIFLDVHNMGAKFFVQIHSRMVKKIHPTMISNFLKLNFPNVVY